MWNGAEIARRLERAGVALARHDELISAAKKHFGRMAWISA
jgi:hypothetical protein